MGLLWWLVDPLCMMLIYWFLVEGLLGRGGSQQAYPLFVLCGLLPWKHLSNSIQRSSSVLRGSRGLLRSVPFPSAVLPLERVLSGFVCLVAGLLLLAVASAVCGRPILSSILQLSLLVVFQLCLVTGLSLVSAALGVIFRDLSTFVSHLLRIVFYLSPILYDLDRVEARVPASLYALYELNPLTMLIHGYRLALFHGGYLSVQSWLALGVSSVLCLIVGLAIYQALERRFLKLL
jgi:lipopolysaccharide transport system permease protein/teichoic acid transport system permease protein